jgi:hypothetical protein
VDRVVERARAVAARLPVPIALENASYYVRFPEADYDEAGFLTAILEGADGVTSLEARRALVDALRHAGDPRLLPSLGALLVSGSPLLRAKAHRVCTWPGGVAARKSGTLLTCSSRGKWSAKNARQRCCRATCRQRSASFRQKVDFAAHPSAERWALQHAAGQRAPSAAPCLPGRAREKPALRANRSAAVQVEPGCRRA